MQKIILPLVLGSACSFVQAQESLENLPDMIVTATRSPVAKHTISAATTVFTRQDIENSQAKSIPELLRGSVGLDVTQSGGYGQQSSIFMRGTNSSHVLVLVDGIKVGSVTTGLTQFEYLPIDQIERVEIIRGPQSSLYGSEAIGGVIQIFTRKGTDSQTPTVTLDAGGGSYDAHRTAGSVSGKINKSWYSASASHFNTEGFDVVGDVNEPDKDGFNNTAVNARFGHHFDNNAELEAFFLHSEGTTNYDGSFQYKTNFVNQTVGTTGSFDVNELWKTTLRLGRSFDESDNFAPKSNKLVSILNTTRWNASWLNQFSISENQQFILGSDYRFDELDGDTDVQKTYGNDNKFQKNSRYDVGVFGEMHSRLFDDHFMNASVRFDENQAFGNYVTGSVGWRYNWNYGISAVANFGNAFKAPTFNDLYAPKSWGSNPNLKPEQSKSYEVGLLGNHSWGEWELRAYRTDIDNLIAWSAKPTTVDPWAGSLDNVNKAQIEGIEAEIGSEIYGFKPKLTMNLLSPEDTKTNKRLARRADKTLSFDLSKSFVAFDLGVAVIAQGSRFDDMANKTNVGGFITVDLRSAYHINKNWMISAKLNNLLDKHYQTVNTYNMADRNFFVSIHYNN